MAGYLEIAAGEVGYRGNPENHTKYWADLAPNFQGQPWCGAFVSWCLKQAGQLSAIGGSPMYYVPSMVSRAKAAGQWSNQPSTGALVIYDFGTGVAAHVEFLVSSSGATLVGIGGNTSGDLVSQKTRNASSVLGYWALSATPGSIPAGSAVAGPAYIGTGALLGAAVQTAQGSAGAVDARFSGRRHRTLA